MSEIKIPLFIQRMGNDILAYILNLPIDEVAQLHKGGYQLDSEREKVLNTFIEICSNLRMQDTDLRDVDIVVMHGLITWLYSLNTWNEQFGGEQVHSNSSDRVVNLVSSLAIELYPLFLIEPPRNRGPFFTSSFSHVLDLYHGKELRELFQAILDDSLLSQIFTIIGDSDMTTYGNYANSLGRADGIQLSTFPATIISNAYELMLLRGNISKQNIIECVSEVIQMLRTTVIGEELEVPVFMGFHNVGLADIDTIELTFGKIRQYTTNIIKLIPEEARPWDFDSEEPTRGFILETRYPYKVDYSSQDSATRIQWPKGLDQARENIEKIKENLSLIFPMAIDRTPPIGISLAWTLVFDPISYGTRIYWYNRPELPMPYFLVEKKNIDSILFWEKLIGETHDDKIRIAIRRILSSINNRINPIDGFIDSVIAWENLFGGNAELSYRISVSIAKLLKTEPDERLTLQKEILKFYNDRSQIVHGSKEIQFEEAKTKRNRCLNIALSSLRALYEHHNDLIADEKRSNKLALM